QLAADPAEHVHGVGYRHGDFDGGDAAVGQCPADFDELATVGGADDGDQADVEDAAEERFARHAGIIVGWAPPTATNRWAVPTLLPLDERLRLHDGVLAREGVEGRDAQAP